MKKKLIIAVISVATVSGLVVGGVAVKHSQAADDTPQVVQQQGQELANHEARITNTENNVRDLQSKTNTPSSSNNVPVPSPTPAPVQATTTAPVVTVTSYLQIPNGDNVDCKFTYSDGSVYQWTWKAMQNSWATDGQGQNGHWVSQPSFTGSCDSSAIGQSKTN